MKKYPYLNGNYDFVLKTENPYYKPGITWSGLTSGSNSFRLCGNGFLFDTNKGAMIFEKTEMSLLYLLGFLNTKVAQTAINLLNSTISLQIGDVAAIPVLDEVSIKKEVENLAKENVEISKLDWNDYETSWEFSRHPLIRGYELIEDAFNSYAEECEERAKKIKRNEELLNQIFVNAYGLQDEISTEISDSDISVRKADKQREIQSLISYAVGCMFGRYSLDTEGLAYAGGEWVGSKYSTFIPDTDNVLPITDEEYLDDDIVGLFIAWLKKVYGENSLEENLDFIANTLGNKGNTSRQVIRNYFIKDFYKDHVKIYQKKPIYWLFDSGKQNGFKALVYLHRYTPDTIGNLRVDYLHKMQRVYESEMNRMQDTIDHSTNSREVAAATKRKEKLQKQLKECRDYDEKIGHLALSRIELDLDDGVKVNYRKVQTASDGKFYEVLADSKNIMAKLKK